MNTEQYVSLINDGPGRLCALLELNASQASDRVCMLKSL